MFLNSFGENNRGDTEGEKADRVRSTVGSMRRSPKVGSDTWCRGTEWAGARESGFHGSPLKRRGRDYLSGGTPRAHASSVPEAAVWFRRRAGLVGIVVLRSGIGISRDCVVALVRDGIFACRQIIRVVVSDPRDWGFLFAPGRAGEYRLLRGSREETTCIG